MLDQVLVNAWDVLKESNLKMVHVVHNRNVKLVGLIEKLLTRNVLMKMVIDVKNVLNVLMTTVEDVVAIKNAKCVMKDFSEINKVESVNLVLIIVKNAKMKKIVWHASQISSF